MSRASDDEKFVAMIGDEIKGLLIEERRAGRAEAIAEMLAVVLGLLEERDADTLH